MKKKTYSTTVGKVVEEKGSGNTMPVYEYKVDGKTYRFMSTTKTRTQSKIGNEVIIYYNPSNPSLGLILYVPAPWLLYFGLSLDDQVYVSSLSLNVNQLQFLYLLIY